MKMTNEMLFMLFARSPSRELEQLTANADELACILSDSLFERAETAEARIAELEAALREIAKGEGEFSRDPSEHAWNTIVNMKGLAMAALGEEGDDDL